ncbi:hypothetical protein DRN69_07455 [Candidatus Pacearchaeota archaeon]|nr:MAG: hypothetical protein DRN69_07455 [Candidatus Pacearchaeota archaeon]
MLLTKLNKEFNYLFLIILLLFAVILGGYVNITSSPSSPFMYDENDVLLFSQNYLKTGRLIYSNDITSLNKEFEYPIASLKYSIWSEKVNASVPPAPLGNYLLTAFSLLIFQKYFHLLNLLFFIFAGVIFAYFTNNTIRYLGYNFNKYIVISVSLILFLSFFPFILWANTWIGAISALFFFVLFLYLIIQYLKNRYYPLLVLSGLIGGLASFCRYEYLLFVLPVFISIAFFKKEGFKKIVIPIIFFLSFFIVVLAFNYYWFGNFFSFGISQRNHILPIFNVDMLTEARMKDLSVIDAFLKIVLTKFLDFDISNLIDNIKTFLIKTFPIYFLLSIIGFISILKSPKLYKPKKSLYLLPTVIAVIIWIYYVYVGDFWGKTNPDWIVGTYFRYSFPVYVGMLFFVVFSILYINNKKYSLKYFVPVIIIYLLVINLSYLFNTSFGLDEVASQKTEAYNINNHLRNLTEENALIWAPHYELFITTRNVLSPWYIIEPKELVLEKVLNYTYILLNKGYHIYYISSEWHRATYLGLDKAFKNDNRFNIELLKGTNGKRYLKYDIYKITLVP